MSKRAALPVIFILSLALLAAAMLYRQWLVSPERSLWQAKKAIDRHDLTSFRKYVNMDRLAEQVADGLWGSLDKIFDAGTVESSGQATGEFRRKLLELVRESYYAQRPQVIRDLKEQIAFYVENGRFREDPDAATGISVELGPEIRGIEFRGIDYVKKDGKAALLGLKFYIEKYRSQIIVEVKMLQLDRYWQIAEVSNLPQVIRGLRDLEKKLGPTDRPD